MITNNSKVDNTFNLPAEETCPQAGECIKDCYARKGNFTRFPMVKLAHERNYQASLKDDFSIKIFDEIVTKKMNRVRIHASGDFYNLVYTTKWLEIAHSLPHVTFYAYTKSIPIFHYFKSRNRIPDNFITIFSFGGKKDHQIDKDNDRHAVIYRNEMAKKYYLKEGYIDSSESDDNALTNNKKIMLKWH